MDSIELEMPTTEFPWSYAIRDAGLVGWTANAKSQRLERVIGPREALLGFRRRDWLQSGFWMSRVVDRDRPAVDRYLTSAARRRSASTAEYRVLDASGTERWIRTFANAGAPGTLSGVHRDVTNESSLDRARVAAERRYELLSGLAGVGLLEYDGTTGSMAIDEMFTAMLGFEPGDSEICDKWIERIHPADRERVAAHSREVFESRPVTKSQPASGAQIEFRVRAHDGTWHWMRKVEALMDDGRGPRLVAALADVTPSVNERLVSRRSEQTYRQVWNSIPGSAVILDGFGAIVDANQSWHEAALLGGAPSGSFVGWSYLGVLHKSAAAGERVAEAAMAGIHDVLRRTVDTFALDYEASAPGQPARWFRMSAFVLKRPVRGAIVVHLDVTDSRLAEHTLRQVRDHLGEMQRLATMSELAQSIAHELNQPLTALIASAETLRRIIPPARRAGIQPVIDDIVESATRAAEVTRRARTMIQHRLPSVESVTLNEIVEAVTRLVANDLLIRQIPLTVDLAPALPPVVADRIQLQQVLLNLLVNAMESVGRLPRERRRIEISTSARSSSIVEMVVADSGPGISREVAQTLFDPFTTTKSNGTGLGLAIVRAIVETHGGRVTVEATAEGGAAFRVSMPSEP